MTSFSAFSLAFLPALACLCLAGSGEARADYQTCGGSVVDVDTIRCPDGSIPIFQVGPSPATPGSSGAGTSGAPGSAATKSGLFGIWHTNRPGISFATSIDVPGSYMLETGAGTAPGDLTIGPNGFFVWNTFRGTSGPWITNVGDYPILLLDEAQKSKIKVGLVDGKLKIVDGPNTYSGHR